MTLNLWIQVSQYYNFFWLSDIFSVANLNMYMANCYIFDGQKSSFI